MTDQAATPPTLFCFGLGFSAQALLRRLDGVGWRFAGTNRDAEERERLRGAGIDVHHFDRAHRLPAGTLDGVTHLLVSVPPDADGDPVFDMHGADIGGLPHLEWLGYLSTTGVYGDRDGGWVDESAPLRPTGIRGRRRVAAEQAWLSLWQQHDIPVHVFRLAGIYGPGRSAFDMLRQGRARRIDKSGQVFSRIHVDDIAAVLAASIARPRPGAVYNVCDDDPSAPEAVTRNAAAMLGVPPPPLVPLEEAGLSPMGRSFYDDNKRVDNTRIKQELGVALRYPDYRAGLAAILAAERAAEQQNRQ